MKIILDTHMYLWALGDPDKIDGERLFEIQSPVNTIYVSSVSIAEMAIKSSIGKLNFDFDPVEIAAESGFEMLDFTGHDAMVLKDLPLHHRDPFDRMLIAQSLNRKIPVLTNDPKFSQYACRVV